MALKSGSLFPNRIPAAWRLIGFGALAAAMLIAPSPPPAEDAQQAVESAVDSDHIQRDRPLAERARDSLGEVNKAPDIQHNPPAPRPEEPPEPPRKPWNLKWLPYIILAVIGIALVFLLLRYVGNRYA